MSRDNKNNNKLAANPDDDPTSELESLATDDFEDLNSDEDTFDFDRPDQFGEASGKSIAALKSDIKSRNESINRLQFDIEQLRARWSGLEKEIHAREDITARLSSQLKDTQSKLSRTEKLLSEKDLEIDAARSSIRDKTSLLQSVESEAKNVSETVKTGQSLIEDLQSRVSEQKAKIRNAKKNESEEATRRKNAEEALDNKTSELSVLHEKVQQVSDDEKSSAKKITELEQQLSDTRAELESSNKTVFALRESQDAEALGTRVADDALRISHEGIITSNTQEIGELRNQISRTEGYADSLRAKLVSLSEHTETADKDRQFIQSALTDATSQIAELKEQLENEKLISADLQKQYSNLDANFADELNKVRFELTTAQQTLTGQESLNEQLASDLIDNQSFRQALESQLESNSDEHETIIRDLRRKLKKLELKNDDVERKLENKDNAIAALLGELASRSHTIESIGEIENVIHEIDGRMSDKIDEKGGVEKDRTARLLIGNVDGQELRFPLFKDRLTIGRTIHNDIQLKAQYISRRHALIVTEADLTKIVDWGSKNGVYVNDSRIVEQVLKNGDIVAIGTAEFRYEERSKR